MLIKQKESVIEFEPPWIPYDSMITDGDYRSISFEDMEWLSKHAVVIVLLNWNGNLLSITKPHETLNADLKIRQYKRYLDPQLRLCIAGKIVKKLKSSTGLIKRLSIFYNLDMITINKEML